MAIAVVNTASAQLVDSATIDVDIAVSGSDKYLLVFVGFDDPSTTFEVSAATYNLASMGAAIQSEVDFNGFVNHLCYAVANPTDGTNNVAITIDGICDEVGLTVIALSGVDQDTPYGTIVAEAATTYTTMDIDVTSATGELVIDSLWFVRHSNTSGAFLTVGADQTSQEEQEDIATWACMGLSTEPGAATTTMSWTPVDSATYGYSYFGLPIKPAAGGIETTINADAGSLNISGTDATFDLNGTTTLVADAGAVGISGTDATLSVNLGSGSEAATTWFNGDWWQAPFWSTTWWGEADAVYSLTAEPGSIELTGQDASFELTGSLNAEPGAVTITGTDATFDLTLGLNAEPGELKIIGTSIRFAESVGPTPAARLLIMGSL